MELRPFEIKDLEQINKWHELRKTEPTPIECLPEYGFIVDNVAACFLYRTDSRVVWCEGFVANPEANKRDIAKAFHVISDALEAKAKELGNVLLLTFSQGKGFARRYKKHGCTPFGKHYLYAKVLVEPVKSESGDLNG